MRTCLPNPLSAGTGSFPAFSLLHTALREHRPPFLLYTLPSGFPSFRGFSCRMLPPQLLFMGRENTAVNSFSHIEKPLLHIRQDALIRFKYKNLHCITVQKIRFRTVFSGIGSVKNEFLYGSKAISSFFNRIWAEGFHGSPGEMVRIRPCVMFSFKNS